MSIQEQSHAATERTEQDAPGTAGEGPELKKSLKSRHMTMISLQTAAVPAAAAGAT